MLNRLTKLLALRLVRLFYSKIDVRGRDNLPGDVPTIFVLNHPNGALDPALLMIALGRPVAFLSKSTLFSNPINRWVWAIFGALPVFRQRDLGKRGGAKDADDMAVRNEETFARCRALLRKGWVMALFPEGTSHSEPELLPLRTGAARIALSAEAETDWAMDLYVVPVGLWYEHKTRFRSRVLLVVGEAFSLDDYAADYAADARQTARAVTDRIEERLDAVVLQAENAELLRGIPALAAWTVPDGSTPDLARTHAWAATLLAAYKKLRDTDPARLERIAEEARRYAALLQAVGVADPWRLEAPSINRGRLAWRVPALVLTAPLALLGFVMNYGPYRLAGVLEHAVNPTDRTMTGTIKLLGGSVLVLVAWIVEAVIVGVVFGWPWGALLFVLAPLLGYAALRWSESGQALREVVSYARLRERRGGLVAMLAARRRALAHAVKEAVEAVSDFSF